MSSAADEASAGMTASVPSNTGNAGTSSAPGAPDPCSNHGNESVCEGSVMHQCVDGIAGVAETCMNEALCQVGLASGMCAVCTPGTFACTGTELNVCTPAGQYTLQETCATEALCNEDAGQCTEMICVPGAVSCSSDGSTLKTCDANGSAFANEVDCQGNGCNQATQSCNTCMPGSKTCAGTSLMTCNADGHTMSAKACVVQGECAVPTCSNNACGSDLKCC